MKGCMLTSLVWGKVEEEGGKKRAVIIYSTEYFYQCTLLGIPKAFAFLLYSMTLMDQKRIVLKQRSLWWTRSGKEKR